jgi:hypothetical protein
MRRLLVLVLVLGMIAAACGDDDAATTTTGAAATTTTAVTGEVYPAAWSTLHGGCIPMVVRTSAAAPSSSTRPAHLRGVRRVLHSTPDLGSDPLPEIIEIACAPRHDRDHDAGGEPSLQPWRTSSMPPS